MTTEIKKSPYGHCMGKFYLPTDYVEKARADINSREAKSIREMMHHMIITRAEQTFERNSIEYYALSDLFVPLEPYSPAPDYNIIITENMGEIYIHAELIK